MGTNASNGDAYLAVSDFLARVDTRTVGRLCSDTNVPVAPDALLTDPNLAAALQDAAGQVESACLLGGRYSAADLAALPGGSPAQGLLFRLITQLAVIYLYQRRPLPDIEKALQYEQAMATLEALSQGTRLFGIQEAISADLVDLERSQDRLVHELYRFFGERRHWH